MPFSTGALDEADLLSDRQTQFLLFREFMRHALLVQPLDSAETIASLMRYGFDNAEGECRNRSDSAYAAMIVACRAGLVPLIDATVMASPATKQLIDSAESAVRARACFDLAKETYCAVMEQIQPPAPTHA